MLKTNVSIGFSVCVIVALSLYFLGPKFFSYVWVLSIAEKEERALQALNQPVKDRLIHVKRSLNALNIRDPKLFDCIRSRALVLGDIHPSGKGGIDAAKEISILRCENHSVSSIEGIEA